MWLFYLSDALCMHYLVLYESILEQKIMCKPLAVHHRILLV